MGRPLQASDAQRQRVLAKRAAGQSLRLIAEEMESGLQTVRTIIDKKDGLDRTTIARLQRIAPDSIAEARTRRSGSGDRRPAQADQCQPEAQRRTAEAGEGHQMTPPLRSPPQPQRGSAGAYPPRYGLMGRQSMPLPWSRAQTARVS